jgi:toxin HigB-1
VECSTLDVSRIDNVSCRMTRSFKDKRAERLFHGERVPHFQSIARQAEKRLRILDAADSLLALRMLPSNHFEALGGDRRGQYSIRINRQWRVCFKWRDDGAHDVEIVDYH